MPKKCVIYARISVSSEESVSVERQIESAEKYADLHGWQVVATFVDDGVSATRNKPEDRPGWRAMLDSPTAFDAVIVWKVDRLARRVIDFLHANETLEERGAGIVAVEDPVDMTTPQGRAFATILAVFGEMEAEAIRARVKAARRTLVHEGRLAGGAAPYGWKSIANPDGAGHVLAQDPETVNFVRDAAERASRGDSVFSIVRWLDESGAPLPKAGQKRRKRQGWSYTTVARLLRNPVLAGLTPYNPGSQTKERGPEVLRDADGLPLVDESIAIMSLADWRGMVRTLDERDTAQSKPREGRSKTSPLLSGLIVCGEHDEPVRMWRGTSQGRHAYYCRECYQTITNFEDVIVKEFLRQKGEWVRWSVVETIHEGGAAVLPEIEQRLGELSGQQRDTKDPDERRRLGDQILDLYDLRDQKRAESPQVVLRPSRESTQSFGEDWHEATTVEEQRAVLLDALERVEVRRAGRGRRTEAGILARLTFEWHDPKHVGPLAE